MFQAYCDASGIFDHRFQSIGVVSGSVDIQQELRRVLAGINEDNGIKEVKFVDVTRYDSREYRAAEAFIVQAIGTYGRYHRIRIDVMTWDTMDSRHAIPGRDDTENLGRLYYHLLRNIIRRWPKDEWQVIIDRDEKVDFENLKNYVNSSTTPKPGTLLEIIYSVKGLEELGVVKEVREVESHKEPLVQLADLFAGLARYSHEKGTGCCQWLESNGNPDQLPLPDFISASELAQDFSKSDECRYKLTGKLVKTCKKHTLGVNLTINKLLFTFNPTNPINFWHYTPQGDYDRAPTS